MIYEGTFKFLRLGNGGNDTTYKGSDIKTWIWLMKSSEFHVENANLIV